MICNHVWIKVHEQFLLGGSFPIGWECSLCRLFIFNDELTPIGLSGSISGKSKLIGVHGCKVISASGRISSYQLLDENNNLTYQD